MKGSDLYIYEKYLKRYFKVERLLMKYQEKSFVSYYLSKLTFKHTFLVNSEIDKKLFTKELLKWKNIYYRNPIGRKYRRNKHNVITNYLNEEDKDLVYSNSYIKNITENRTLDILFDSRMKLRKKIDYIKLHYSEIDNKFKLIDDIKNKELIKHKCHTCKEEIFIDINKFNEIDKNDYFCDKHKDNFISKYDEILEKEELRKNYNKLVNNTISVK